MTDSPLTFVTLPPEVIGEIVSVLPKVDLLRLRCVSRHLAFIITPHAFRSLNLHGCGDRPERFMKIAESNHLSGYVREINCDTWGGRHADYPEGPRKFTPNNLDRDFPSDFFDALPFLVCFRNLKALHLRCGRDHDTPYFTIMREPPSFLRAIFDIIFHCLAGTWSDDKQRQLQDAWRGGGYKAKKTPLNLPTDLIPITTLTISNLIEYTDPLLTNSTQFQSVLGSSSLVDLRLYIATQTYGKHREWDLDTETPEQYEMFTSLPSTWLSLSVAANLQVLSLYCHERWGWLPQIDSQMNGLDGEIPNLKVLSLGRFVFSHPSQIDWVGSLGLEKLYLHDCAVLHKSAKPINVRMSKIAAARRARGRDIFANEEGYNGENPDDVFPGYIGWHNILSHWRESMSELRVFKVAYGEKVRQTRRDPRDPFLYTSTQSANVFRYFDSPSTNDSGHVVSDNGNGKVHTHEDRLAYVYYEGFDGGAEVASYMKARNASLELIGEKYLERGLTSKDEAALSLLEATVEARRMRMVLYRGQ
ncbi:hypothetical protein G7Z17_g2762 [Cylindrodendrum hubeiense]|uniref:F-box domain-containing protein n=1 Tax=Cylindrodendrum hubeiense TaxID=595255 RepID=A0A9P5LK06_9HYPO|nr:hypothetical protein G7Z17_g2762 [Cylindrodendrum hubeiense]